MSRYQQIGRLSGLWVFLLSSIAFAQNPSPQFEAQILRPSPYPGAILDTVIVQTPGHKTFAVKAWGNWARRPFRTELADTGAATGDLVAGRVDAQLAVSLAMWKRVTFGLDGGYIAHHDGVNSEILRAAVNKESLDGGLTDIRLSTLAHIHTSDGWLPGLAVGGSLLVPTGPEESLGGQPGVAYELLLAISGDTPRHVGGIHVGYRGRTEPMQVAHFEVENEIFWSAGYSYTFGRYVVETPWSLLLNASGHTPADAAFGSGDIRDAQTRNTVEGRVGLRFRAEPLGGLVDITIAGGVGIIGYGGPLPRALLAVEVLSSNPVGDVDGDGIATGVDECPDDPEDKDDFEDHDGCPDLDNDNDEIPDEDDECPNQQEDYDGQEDLDGCPDEHLDDDDGDGVLNGQDRCIDAREDADGFEDEDGCPDDDNDRDGLPDLNDVCPDKAEDFDAHEDDDGCPDEGNHGTFVRLGDERVEFKKAIAFMRKRDTLLRRSTAVANQLAAVLQADKTLTAAIVRIYPDKRSKSQIALAKARSVALVRYLVEAGVSEALLRTEEAEWSRRNAGRVEVLIER